MTRLTALSVSLLVMGCSSAHIIKKDGTIVEGRIASGDEENLYVESGQWGEERIARTDIDEIYHPGSGAVVGGTFLVTMGLATFGTTSLIASEFDSLEESGAMPLLIGAGTASALGLLMMTVGIFTMGASEERSTSRIDGSWGMGPVLLPDEAGRARAGVGMMWMF